jgi:hypothetical protein
MLTGCLNPYDCALLDLMDPLVLSSHPRVDWMVSTLNEPRDCPALSLP